MTTSCLVVRPIVGGSKKILVLNINEMLGRPDCFDVSHVYAEIYGYTLSPHKMLHSTPVPKTWSLVSRK
jgi:hypothetical protein